MDGQFGDIISWALDLVLVVAGIAAYIARPRIGGQLARGLRVLLAGVIILGFAHLIETALFVFFNVPVTLNEIAHRIIVGFGFIWVIVGFVIMRRAFEE